MWAISECSFCESFDVYLGGIGISFLRAEMRRAMFRFLLVLVLRTTGFIERRPAVVLVSTSIL